MRFMVQIDLGHLGHLGHLINLIDLALVAFALRPASVIYFPPFTANTHGAGSPGPFRRAGFLLFIPARRQGQTNGQTTAESE